MRLRVAIVGVAAVILSASAGQAASDPIGAAIRREAAKLAVKDQSLERENARLRQQLRKARRSAKVNGQRARQARRQLRSVLAHDIDGYARAGLRCIHTHEGAWNAATGNGYYGGLQMDTSFQRTYGKPLLDHLGTANHWPPAAQLAVGEIAYYAGRGFGPWPNTRRMCGL